MFNQIFLVILFRGEYLMLKESSYGLFLSLVEGGQVTVTLNMVKHFSSDILRMTYDAHRLMSPLLRRKKLHYQA